jgi:hypothetical protein
MSEAANVLLQPHFVVNRKMRIVAKKDLAAALQRGETRDRLPQNSPRSIRLPSESVMAGLDTASRVYKSDLRGQARG